VSFLVTDCYKHGSNHAAATEFGTAPNK
jgi:hypothetical protein